MQEHNKHHGLTPQQVAESREKHGSNILTPKEKQSLWMQFLNKFTDPLIIILMVAGVLSVGIACYEYWGLGESNHVFFEPVGIFVAILLATGLAFYFEHQAEKEFAVLNKVSDDELVEVIRSEGPTQVPRRDIVVGDIVVLATGSEVPADGILLEATQLAIDESTLTGEPICHKTTDEAHFDANATFPSNTAMRGTKVMEGHGVMQVTAVGDATETGKVFEAVQIDNSIRTPLDEQLDRLGRTVSWMSYTVAALVVVGRLVMFFINMPEDTTLTHVFAHVLQSFMIAVTLIVVAVPEGLPMAVTLSLAYSMRRMLKTNNLVRRMHACETMGATTVICTDKTGTLTQNRMTVSDIQLYDESKDELLKQGMAINSTAALDLTAGEPTVLGNPTEGALLLWLRDQGCDYEAVRQQATVADEVPFTTERKYMSTTTVDPLTKQATVFVKGAPEIVLSLCTDIAGGVERSEVEQQLLAYQSQGMRTLGFAVSQPSTHNPQPTTHNPQPTTHNPLTFLAIAAISDPVRPDVPDAIAECHGAGIDVKIVTGDTPATARQIAQQIGLLHEPDATCISDIPDTHGCEVITGPEFAALTDEQLLARVQSLKVIARARPMDKKRLVEALQKVGHVVAVTGDGTNDAPALKAAHVGLSMGAGTAVAKEASDITIIDNSFASIGRAVMWGRSLYQNIQRFLLFQLTVNVSACLIVLAGAFMGTESPLTVTQMLWVNLIMDTFGAMALASLPPTEGVMHAKPRNRQDFILGSDMLYNILGVGLAFFLMLFGLLYIFQHADIRSMLDLLEPEFVPAHEMTPYEQTLLFSIFVWTHFWYMFCARAFYTGRSVLRLAMSRGFWIIVLAIVVGQLVITEVMPDFFNVVPMLYGDASPCGFTDFLLIVILSSLVLWIREGWALIKRAIYH